MSAVVTLGVSSALIINKDDTSMAYLAVSDVTLGLSDNVTSITIDKVIPTLDKFGLTNDSFNFTVTNTDDITKNFVIRLIDSKVPSTFTNSNIRYQLIRDNTVYDIKNLSNSGVIDAGSLEANATYIYQLKLWLDYQSEVNNGTWSKVISVMSGGVNIDVSGANEPLLTDNLIPVYYDNNTLTWKKADSSNININYEWYDYDKNKWANAVTIVENVRRKYIDADNGTEIAMEDINSMWVWIPRYKYVLFDSDNVKAVKVVFEGGIKTTGTVNCTNSFSGNLTEKCIDTINNGLLNNVSTYTHPAFTFGNEELTGFWVSKFEAGVDSDSNCYKSFGSTSCNNANQTIYLKPNVKSLTYISMANMAYSFRKMELKDNIYGFNSLGTKVNSDLSIEGDTNNIDIHMIKNMEWGAVSYLAKSIYGINSTDIYVNNSLITGCSSDSINGDYCDKCQYAYDIGNYGTKASTTGNIYGIYDMVGGSSEYVMLNYQEDDGIFVNSSYTDFINPYPLKDYYNAYYIGSKTNNTYLLGDAIKETSKWYSASVLTNYNSLVRGFSGITSYDHTNTLTNSKNGSRPVLKIKQNMYITEW